MSVDAVLTSAVFYNRLKSPGFTPCKLLKIGICAESILIDNRSLKREMVPMMFARKIKLLPMIAAHKG